MLKLGKLNIIICIMNELIYNLLYEYISFKDMMLLRSLTNETKNIYNNPNYWKVINLTEISIRDINEIIDIFNDSKNVILYNLSKERYDNIFTYPASLSHQFLSLKLLIY